MSGERDAVGPAPGSANEGPPDTSAVNSTWRAEAVPPRGLSGIVFRLLERFWGPQLDAQRRFNSDQVQLDNETIRYVTERSAATHRHYDALLGDIGQRLGDVDVRHQLLQRDLLAHVDDLVRRIDLVLTEAERGRLSLEHEVRRLRRRLEELPRSPSGT
jgi:hypothetical protein